jgi:acyl-CoA thioester hydrolase
MSDQLFTAETTFPVRYAETDAMGIVHHASYLVYFEEGRSAYTRARGRSYADMETDGYFLAVTEVQVRYRQAVRYGQSVTVRCWLTQMKSRTLRFAYEIRDAATDELCVTGETGHICITPDGKPARFPESWRTWD